MAAGPAIAPEAVFRTESASLFGRLTAAQSGVPVVGATLEASSIGVGTRTNSAGGFLMLGVPADSPVQVRIRHPCFYSVIVEVTPQEDSAPLLLGLPPRTQRIEDSDCYRYRPREGAGEGDS